VSKPEVVEEPTHAKGPEQERQMMPAPAHSISYVDEPRGASRRVNPRAARWESPTPTNTINQTEGRRPGASLGTHAGSRTNAHACVDVISWRGA